MDAEMTEDIVFTVAVFEQCWCEALCSVCLVCGSYSVIWCQ